MSIWHPAPEQCLRQTLSKLPDCLSQTVRQSCLTLGYAKGSSMKTEGRGAVGPLRSGVGHPSFSLEKSRDNGFCGVLSRWSQGGLSRFYRPQKTTGFDLLG